MTAATAEAMLRSSRGKLEAGAKAICAKPVAIMEKQIAALSKFGQGQREDALRLAKEAMEIELSMNAPSGPPEPIKPGPGFYGELLIEAGRHSEAVAALELSLQRTPSRTPSVKAMQRARASGTAVR